MIVFAIIVFKTTALNRSATGPEKLRFPWCPPQRDEWGTPNKRSLFENLKIKDFELQGNFDCKKYAQRYTFRYSEKLPPLGYDGSIAYPRFDRKRVPPSEALPANWYPSTGQNPLGISSRNLTS